MDDNEAEQKLWFGVLIQAISYAAGQATGSAGSSIPSVGIGLITRRESSNPTAVSGSIYKRFGGLD